MSPVGRPPGPGREAYPELAELSAWFRDAVRTAGFESVRAFVQRHTLDKNRIYDLAAGRTLLSLESTRQLAHLLGDAPDRVERLWLRAKEAMDRRVMAADAEQGPRVTSWTAVPLPELALRNVLDGLAEAVEVLPYRLLGVAPPALSEVYVRQRLRQDSGRAAAAGKADHREERHAAAEPFANEVPVTLSEALDRDEHLLVTGEPGAGKSTLGNNLIARLARIWLRQESAQEPPLAEPVVPVRISARSLVGDGSWSALLAAAVRLALGSYLVTDPSPHLFTGRSHGVRWLVVVDGLDEILDNTARASVIRTLGRHARPGGDFRIVITSRPLPEEELAPLRAARFGMCRVESFETAELRQFADRWFLAQDPVTGARQAAEFLRQVEDSRIRELVRNPLLATIAAVAHTREPDRPLPANRVELYQRFYEYLVTDEDAPGRGTPAELMRLRDAHPDRYRLAVWVHRKRAEIADVMARERLTTEVPVAETARDWVEHNRPADLPLPHGWQDDLERLLTGTGLFVRELSGLRFLHHTFAEFLAARSNAREIPADFPGLDGWIARGLKAAQRDFVLMTLVLWSRRRGNDPGLVLRRLLEGGRPRLLLAGRLLAELEEAPDAEARAVVDRLFDLALGSALFASGEADGGPAEYGGKGIDERYRDSEKVFDVIQLLRGREEPLARLRQIATCTELPFLTRVLALAAMAEVAGREEAVPLLRPLLPWARNGLELAVVAAGLIELNDEPPDDVSELLHRAAVAPGHEPQRAAFMAGIHAHRGDIDRAVHFHRQVLGDRMALPTDIRDAVEYFAEHQGAADVPSAEEIVGAVGDRADHLLAVAQAFNKAGLRVHVPALARRVIAEPNVRLQQIQAASALWLSTATDPPEALVEAVRAIGGDKDALAQLADDLATAGCTEHAGRIAEELLAGSLDGGSLALAAKVWLAGNPSAGPEELMRRPACADGIDAWCRQELAEELADAGHLTVALPLARSVLVDPQADHIDLQAAAAVCLKSEAAERQEILEALMGRDESTPERRVETAVALSRLDFVAEAHSLALSVLADARTGAAALGYAVSMMLELNGSVAGADLVTGALAERPVDPWLRMQTSDRLARAGALPAAVTLWCGLLTDASTPAATALAALTRLLHTCYRETALTTLRTALAAPDVPFWGQTRMRQLLAWAEASGGDAEGP